MKMSSGKNLSRYAGASGVLCWKKPVLVSRGGTPPAPVPADGSSVSLGKLTPSSPVLIQKGADHVRSEHSEKRLSGHPWVPPNHNNAKFFHLLLPTHVSGFVCFHEESYYCKEIGGILLIVLAHLCKLFQSWV